MLDTQQIVVTGRVKETARDTEIIHFSINLGLFQLICIVNIPDEGQTEAPVYVKFRVRERG